MPNRWDRKSEPGGIKLTRHTWKRGKNESWSTGSDWTHGKGLSRVNYALPLENSVAVNSIVITSRAPPMAATLDISAGMGGILIGGGRNASTNNPAGGKTPRPNGARGKPSPIIIAAPAAVMLVDSIAIGRWDSAAGQGGVQHGHAIIYTKIVTSRPAMLAQSPENIL